MRTLLYLLLTFVLIGSLASAQSSKASAKRTGKHAQTTWSFALSGDSRNCGDIVMPAIAAGAEKDGAKFYWHLGDYRWMTDVDDDLRAASKLAGHPITQKTEYWPIAWQDFIDHQLGAFHIPVFLGIGNHELVVESGRNRDNYVAQFADWLDNDVIREQRLADSPDDHMVRTYYHWRQGGVDFITLDNAYASLQNPYRPTKDQFNDAQLGWFLDVLKRAETAPDVKAVVVGSHAALPDSLAYNHSMSDKDWPVGEASGQRAYAALVEFHKKTKKPVYIFASHSHFYIANVFNTDAHKQAGTVLPGWIVGTAGAFRYKLPAEAAKADDAQTDVYGYVLGTVRPDGNIDFTFRKIERSAVPQAVVGRYGAEQTDRCFSDNSEATQAPPSGK